jgi:hypothetical protein|tara:strand:+ start:12 stop:470 length:459 start_codon:yes stop_codon:yes gene_type:complete
MTAFVINDRVKQTTTTTGTGTIDLTGTETGFETFVAGIGDGVQTYYAIVHDGTSDFEVGTGTVTDAGTDTLSRQSVISSSNSDALVNFGAGSKTVFCTLPAKKTISPVMDATPYVVTHASTLSLNQTIDSGVLAGPVTVTGTQIITGTVVVV